MKKNVFLMVFAGLFCLLAGCAGKRVDPNYKAMLDAHKQQVETYAGIDRSVFKLEVGDTPLTLPPGAKLTVNSQLPELELPTMFRDYRQEAQLKFWGGLLTTVGGQGLGGLFKWLGQREDRKLFDGIFAARQGIDFTATGDINFSGGIGDYGTRGYSPTITPAPVVVPPVINNVLGAQP